MSQRKTEGATRHAAHSREWKGCPISPLIKPQWLRQAHSDTYTEASAQPRYTEAIMDRVLQQQPARMINNRHPTPPPLPRARNR